MPLTPVVDASYAERVSLITSYLLEGNKATAADFAACFGISVRTARRTLNKLSRVQPFYRDDDGLWRKMKSNGSK